MNCPEGGSCHDAEWCQQGGSCAAAKRVYVEQSVSCASTPREPWPRGIVAGLGVWVASLGFGVVGSLCTWSLWPLGVTAGGAVVAMALTASALPWREMWRDHRERCEQRDADEEFARIMDEEFTK